MPIMGHILTGRPTWLLGGAVLHGLTTAMPLHHLLALEARRS